MPEVPEKLPTGWLLTTLGELVGPSRERALPGDYPTLRYVGLEHIEPQTMKLIGHGYAREIRSPSVRFSKGDILYGRLRPYLNKVWVATFPGLCSAEFLVFPKRTWLNSRFLAIRLNAEDFVAFANSRTSGERPRVDFDALSGFPVLLPPLAEQHRIVSKVAAAFARLEQAKAATNRARERLSRYRAAVLRSASTGELTRTWRDDQRGGKAAQSETGEALLQRLLVARRARWKEAELQRLVRNGKQPKEDWWDSHYQEPASPDTSDLPDIPPSWTWARLQQLGFIVGGLTKNPRRMTLPLQLPYLRVANVYADELRLDNVSSIGVDNEELDKLLLESGDLLIVEGNGSKDQIGRLAIWDGSIEPCVHQNHIIKVRLVDKQLGSWILSWLLSSSGREQIERVASSTTGLYTLSINKVGDLPVPLPPAVEQEQINREVERRIAAADRLAATLNRQLERAQETRRSLLRQAIMGLLVSQDASEGSALDLLERIRVARKAEAQKPKDKRMSRKSSPKTPVRRPLLAVLRESGGSMTPEELFRASGYSQETVDEFYAELRELTSIPPQVSEERTGGGVTRLKVV